MAEGVIKPLTGQWPERKEEMRKQKIKVELVETNFFTRWPCHVCGGTTDKVPILAEVRKGRFKGFRVCERCIEKRGFDAAISVYAKRLERETQKKVAELRALVGRLNVPTYEEYKARGELYNVERFGENYKELESDLPF